MKRQLAALLFFALVSTLAAPLAARASATGGPLLPPLPPRKLMTQVGAPVPPTRSFRSGFEVEGADGPYGVGVSTFGSSVTLVVFQEHRKEVSETLYLARGVATPDRLQATFGHFGGVKMRFRERSKHQVCHGRLKLTRHKGVFVGNLRFKGENGYVSVHLHRAVGGILEPSGRCPRQRRRRRRSHGGDDGSSILFASPAALVAQAREGVDATGVLALEFLGIAGVLASHQENRGKLAIIREALVYTHPAFHVNEAATSAKLAPPVPFHGTGRYRAAPDGSYTWTGDLSVNFPGAPRFPLTGPQFELFLEAPF